MLIIHGGNDYASIRARGLSMFQVLQAKHVRRNFLLRAEEH